ncbi:MAG: hypothetical protein MUF75_01645 [Bacteroidia bacterium]|jgi:hypothetical protein|nr:hypothetical protein [Bacteroidia bacterium]
MLKTVAEHTVRKLAQQTSARLQKKFLNWENINTIALVVEDSEKISKHQLDALCEQFNKHCDVFYLELASKKPSYSDWFCFTKKDKNVLGLPKKKTILPLKAKRYDVLINTSNQSILFSAALSASIHSTCVCSSTEKFGHSNLIVTRAKNQTLGAYLQDVQRYLKMINPN